MFSIIKQSRLALMGAINTRFLLPLFLYESIDLSRRHCVQILHLILPFWYRREGIKVYTTEEKELITELSIKWAGNPNITVAVKAFGLKAVIQAVDLQIFLVPRITLKPLVSTFPCFAKIFVSFMDKPHADFGLKLLGADAGLYRFVLDKIKNQVANVLHDTINNQVANMYLWPRTLEVAVMDASKAMKKPVGILHVNVLRAQKLRKKYLMGKADPYVKLKLMDDKLPSKKTTVKKNNLNPEWNEEFKFLVADPESQALELNVYDWEQVGNHEKMGTNIINLKHLTPDKPTLFTLELLKNLDGNDAQNEKLHGQLVTEVTYKPLKEDELPEVNENAEEVEKAPEGTPFGGGLLVVTIHEAQDLEGKHHTNPYVRLTFRGEEKKTKHIKKSGDPCWEEEFQFVCEKPPVNDKMHLEVCSRPPSISIHSKENLGYVIISMANVVAKERIIENYRLIDSKNTRIQVESRWKPS